MATAHKHGFVICVMLSHARKSKRLVVNLAGNDPGKAQKEYKKERKMGGRRSRGNLAKTSGAQRGALVWFGPDQKTRGSTRKHETGKQTKRRARGKTHLGAVQIHADDAFVPDARATQHRGPDRGAGSAVGGVRDCHGEGPDTLPTCQILTQDHAGHPCTSEGHDNARARTSGGVHGGRRGCVRHLARQVRAAVAAADVGAQLGVAFD